MIPERVFPWHDYGHLSSACGACGVVVVDCLMRGYKASASPRESASPAVSQTAPPSPTGSEEPEPSPSPSLAREMSSSPGDPGMLGMHVAWAQERYWPSDRVPVDAFWLGDPGTSWLQAEAVCVRYDWRVMDRAL